MAKYFKPNSEKSSEIVIIGSGISGLMAGALLSEYHRVVILEQHPETIGGCTHTFNKFGNTFDTGLHYIGGLGVGVKNILNRVAPELEFENMDYEFDRVRYSDGEFRIPSDPGVYKQRLCFKFPEEKDIIYQYFKDCEKVCSKAGLYYASKLWFLPSFIGNAYLD